MRLGNYRFDENLAVLILQKAAFVIVTLIVTWALAKLAKWAFAKLVDNVAFFREHNTESGETMGSALGRIIALLIWLVGLIVILGILGLGDVILPLQGLLENVVDIIPNVIGAAILFFVGLVIAKIARDITVTALQTFDFDKWINRGGGETLTGNPRLSKTLGTIVYAVIAIFFTIAALDVLDIRAISGPASDMLSLILRAIPLIIGAAILLGIGYLVSRFVVDLIKNIMVGFGADQAFGSTELLPGNITLSSVVARVAQIAIILFFAIAATRLLGFPELTALLGEILELAGQVIFGAVVILAGFLIARMLARMIGGTEESGLAATVIKWATIILFTFMGLTFMGIGEEIVQLAFGALVIGAAVAGALAFGIGGREWAGRKLEQLDDKAREHASRSPGSPATRTRTVTGTDNDPLPPGA